MCRNKSTLDQQLYPGRTCIDHSQCRSNFCDNGKCAGRANGESCATHADCSHEHYCDLSTEFPFLSQCKRQRSSYEPCTEMYQCQNNQYCWYPFNKDKDPRKQCLPMFSQFINFEFGWQSEDLKNPTLSDYLINGQYCKSGLAYLVAD